MSWTGCDRAGETLKNMHSAWHKHTHTHSAGVSTQHAHWLHYISIYSVRLVKNHLLWVVCVCAVCLEGETKNNMLFFLLPSDRLLLFQQSWCNITIVISVYSCNSFDGSSVLMRKEQLFFLSFMRNVTSGFLLFCFWKQVWVMMMCDSREGFLGFMYLFSLFCVKLMDVLVNAITLNNVSLSSTDRLSIAHNNFPFTFRV